MPSTDELRLLSVLSEGSLEHFEPIVSDEGRVEYTEVEEMLTHRDGTSKETLNSLAKRGLLHKEYTTKVYVCPSCQNEGMQYITACLSCESTHIIRTTFFEHEHCGYTAESIEFEMEDSTDTYQCPDCETELESSGIDTKQKYLCKECGNSFENPDHRLWCLDCLYLCSPRKATEQILYEYELTEDGKNWYEAQIRARKLLADELAARGFNVHIGTTVQNDENEPYPVHIHAEDDLLNQRIVVDIHSTINFDKLQYISTAAEEIQAQPFFLVTDDSIPNDILQVSSRYGVTVFWIDQDYSINRYKDLNNEHHSSSNIIERLSSVVDLTS